MTAPEMMDYFHFTTTTTTTTTTIQPALLLMHLKHSDANLFQIKFISHKENCFIWRYFISSKVVTVTELE